MAKLFIFTTFLICVWSTIALGFSTTAKTALVVDNTTGEVLLSKDIDRPIPPASMSKLMTLWMVFESLDEGKIELDDTCLLYTSPSPGDRTRSRMPSSA